MKLKFPYYFLPYQYPSGKIIKVKKPLIKVKLCHKHEILNTSFFALLDTGADICLCSAEIANLFNIKYKKGRKLKIRGIAGNILGYKISLEVYIKNNSYKCPFYVVESLPRETPVILGQKGFFYQNKITFDILHNEITIEEILLN